MWLARNNSEGERRGAASAPTRLAIIVSHPIQYFAPLYQRLARRSDITLKVFFTWHGGGPVYDRGFNTSFGWDIPVNTGYDFEVVPTLFRNSGTHHFFGLINPSLVRRVRAWRPDVVQVTGWAWLSHLIALWAFPHIGIPTLFRGDSHLLDAQPIGVHWWIKHAALSQIYAWPTAFLVVGEANRAYYEAFGVEPARLHACPHSIDVGRFAEPSAKLEQEAADWREDLGIPRDHCVILFAGKFERKKRPLELMKAVQGLAPRPVTLIMVGNGELDDEVKAVAAAAPARFRLLPFQNQSRMPAVYRLGDLFVLPSAYNETWGLAVNEALACGRPVLASDRVGCAADVVDASCGRVFASNDAAALGHALNDMCTDRDALLRMRPAAAQRARQFDVSRTEAALVDSIRTVRAS